MQPTSYTTLKPLSSSTGTVHFRENSYSVTREGPLKGKFTASYSGGDSDNTEVAVKLVDA